MPINLNADWGYVGWVHLNLYLLLFAYGIQTNLPFVSKTTWIAMGNTCNNEGNNDMQ